MRKGEEGRVASRRVRLKWTGGKWSNHWMRGEVFVCFNAFDLDVLWAKAGEWEEKVGCAGIE